MHGTWDDRDTRRSPDVRGGWSSEHWGRWPGRVLLAPRRGHHRAQLLRRSNGGRETRLPAGVLSTLAPSPRDATGRGPVTPSRWDTQGRCPSLLIPQAWGTSAPCPLGTLCEGLGLRPQGPSSAGIRAPGTSSACDSGAQHPGCSPSPLGTREPGEATSMAGVTGELGAGLGSKPQMGLSSSLSPRFCECDLDARPPRLLTRTLPLARTRGQG